MNKKEEKKLEIEEVFAEESNRGIDLDAARIADESGVNIYDGPPYKSEQHHHFLQQCGV